MWRRVQSWVHCIEGDVRVVRCVVCLVSWNGGRVCSAVDEKLVGEFTWVYMALDFSTTH